MEYHLGGVWGEAPRRRPDRASTLRVAADRSKALSLAKACSIGFKSGE
jgi:hypothetical protein